MIRTEQLTKKYKTLSGEVLATDNVNLHISCNGLYMILGKSGCGKTTLLNILSGLDRFDEGHVYIDGSDLNRCSEKELDQYRNLKMGIVFQEYNLISELTVFDNLRIVLEIQEWAEKDEAAVRTLIQEMLSKVGLTGYETRHIYELSGGERQRVAIARTLVKQPNIIFADEPTGNLDSKTAASVFELLSEIAKEYVVVVVTHDRDAAFRYGDTVIEMENGSVREIQHQDKTEQFAVFRLTCQKNAEQPEEVELKYVQLGSFFAELLSNAGTEDSVRLSGIRKEKPVSGTEEHPQKSLNRRTPKTVRNLPTGYHVRLAASFLTKKKLILFLTVCVLSIAFALLFGALTTTFYQRDKTMILYLQKYRPEVLPVFAEKTYQDSFYQTQTETLTKGEYLSDLLARALPSDSVRLEAIYDCFFFKGSLCEDEEAHISDVTLMFIPDEGYPLTLSDGAFPVKNDECLITDYIASELDVRVGDCITDMSQDYHVSGIVKTDYIEYQLKSKMMYGDDSLYLDYYLNYRYLVVYCRSELLHGEMKKSSRSIRLPMTDFSAADKERSYRESAVLYDNAGKVSNSDLVAGSMPQAANEVLVSEYFLSSRNLYDKSQEFKPFSAHYSDLSKSSYHESLSGYLDLSKQFPNGIRIVGVVLNDSEKLDADVYLMSDVWKQIAQQYYDYYTASFLYHTEPNNISAYVRALSGTDVRIEEPALLQIYNFADGMKGLRAFLLALLVITLLLSGFVLTNFIQISIRGNKRNIGVLRALGISMKDVTRLFILETWFVFAFAAFFSVPLIMAIQRIANRIFTNGMTEKTYQIINWNWTAFLIVLAVGAAVGFFALQIPLRQLRRSKPIELIR